MYITIISKKIELILHRTFIFYFEIKKLMFEKVFICNDGVILQSTRNY